MALLRAKIQPTLEEKRYITLQMLEAGYMSGSRVQITPVDTYGLTTLSGEVITYKDPVETYIIFDERPKPYLLQKLGWYRENAENVPILAYIPTHLLYAKNLITEGLLELQTDETLKKFNNIYDSTVVTSNDRVLRVTDGVYVDITDTFNLGADETIVDLKSHNNGAILRTSSNRLFVWGFRSREGWTICPDSGTAMGYFDNEPKEIDQIVYDLIGEDSISIFEVTISYSGGVYIVTDSGKIITWGNNYESSLLAYSPSLSTIYHLSPGLRTAVPLNVGESIVELSHYRGFKVFIRTSDERILTSTFVTNRYNIVENTDINSVLEEGETFTQLLTTFTSYPYLITSNNRIIRTNQNLATPTDITSYYTALLDEGETIVSYHTNPNVDSAAGTSYPNLYCITSNGRIIGSGDVLGTTSRVTYSNPEVFDIGLLTDYNEKVIDITWEKLFFGDVLKYVTLVHTNLGRAIMFNEVENVADPEDLTVAYGYEVSNENLLDGTIMQQLVKTGESTDYVLKEIKITRGATIDVFYDFAPDKLNKFYVADAKTDLVSINYVANLVPYKYEKESEATEEQNESNGKFLNFDSGDYGI